MDVVAWNKCDINELVIRVFVLAINFVRLFIIPVNAKEASFSSFILECFEELSLLVPDRVELIVVLFCAPVMLQKFFFYYTVFGIIVSEHPSYELRIKFALRVMVAFKRNCKSEIDLVQVHRIIFAIKLGLLICRDVRIMSYM